MLPLCLLDSYLRALPKIGFKQSIQFAGAIEFINALIQQGMQRQTRWCRTADEHTKIIRLDTRYGGVSPDIG